MKYLEFINKNDFVGEFKFLPRDEKDGAIGIAIVLSYLNGTNSDIEDVARHLGVRTVEIEKPFRRLKHNGAFYSWNLRKDKALLGQLGDDEAKRAYQYIAAYASGFLGNVL